MRLFLFWITSLFFCAIVSSEAKASAFVPDVSQSLFFSVEKTATNPSYIAADHSAFQLNHFSPPPFLPSQVFSLEIPKLFQSYEASISLKHDPKSYSIRSGLSPPTASA